MLDSVLTTDFRHRLFQDAFKDHAKKNVEHHISSYNHLIDHGLLEILQKKIIESIYVKHEKKYRYRVIFETINVPKPHVVENGIIREITPTEARHRDFNYESPVLVDMCELWMPEDRDETDTEEIVVKRHHQVHLFTIPVMVCSKICILGDMSSEQRVKTGHHVWDQGGYFIINGNEKVIVSQIKLTDNTVVCFSDKTSTASSSRKKYSHCCSIRSFSEETSHSLEISVHMGKSLKIKRGCSETYIDDTEIKISFPKLKSMIPVGVLFKALGYTTQAEIQELIGLDRSFSKYILYIYGGGEVSTQAEAIEYIKQNILPPRKHGDEVESDFESDSEGEGENTEEAEYYNTQVSKILSSELFPHLGMTASVRDKALFLGYMISKLLKLFVCKDESEEINIDDYEYKRIENSGILMASLISIAIKKFVSKVKDSNRRNIMVHEALTKKITSTILRSFTNSWWGAEKSYKRSGVIKQLERVSPKWTISDMRAVSRFLPEQLGNSAKNIMLRMIQGSQYGYTCCVESPEGKNAGIVLNLCNLVKISKKINTVEVRGILEKFENFRKMEPEDEISDFHTCTKVFVNTCFVGLSDDPEEMLEEFEEMYKYGVDENISICYNEEEDIIKIYCDEGRLLRPLFRVYKGECLLEKDIRSGVLTETQQTSWDYLVQKRYIVFVDPLTASSSLIAPNPEKLQEFKERGLKTSYMEIDPNMMLGQNASFIPFPDHNQSPRNIFYSSMGKQSIGYNMWDINTRCDTTFNSLTYAQKPISSTVFGRMSGLTFVPTGFNVMLAVLTGENQEDSLTINKGAIERGLFTSSKFSTETYSTVLENKEVLSLEIPPEKIRNKKYNYSKLDSRGIIREGVYVKARDVLVGLVYRKTVKVKNSKDETRNIEKDCSEIPEGEDIEEGRVHKVFVTKTSGGSKLIKIVIRKTRLPELGDKFCSRGAQKGICGAIVQEVDLPFVSDGTSDNGIRPDIIMNPNAYPSRMTIGQILELVLNSRCCLQGEYGDCTAFSESSVNVAEELRRQLAEAGEPDFDPDFVLKTSRDFEDKVVPIMKRFGFSGDGKRTLVSGITGECLEAKVFMGPVYYHKLKHMVSDKVRARARGKKDLLTRQPQSGRKNQGGLKVGEMERDCIISHGTTEVLRDRLFLNSDKYSMPVCVDCGFMVSDRTYCSQCEGTKTVLVDIPYVSKQIFFNLMTAGVDIRINPATVM